LIANKLLLFCTGKELINVGSTCNMDIIGSGKYIDRFHCALFFALAHLEIESFRKDKDIILQIKITGTLGRMRN